MEKLLKLFDENCKSMHKLCNQEGPIRDISPFVAGLRRADIIATILDTYLSPGQIAENNKGKTEAFAATMRCIADNFTLNESYMDEIYYGLDEYLDKYLVEIEDRLENESK